MAIAAPPAAGGLPAGARFGVGVEDVVVDVDDDLVAGDALGRVDAAGQDGFGHSHQSVAVGCASLVVGLGAFGGAGFGAEGVSGSDSPATNTAPSSAQRRP